MKYFFRYLTLCFKKWNPLIAELVQLSEWYRKRMNFAPYEVRKYDSKCETVFLPHFIGHFRTQMTKQNHSILAVFHCNLLHKSLNLTLYFMKKRFKFSKSGKEIFKKRWRNWKSDWKIKKAVKKLKYISSLFGIGWEILVAIYSTK